MTHSIQAMTGESAACSHFQILNDGKHPLLRREMRCVHPLIRHSVDEIMAEYLAGWLCRWGRLKEVNGTYFAVGIGLGVLFASGLASRGAHL